MIIDNTYFIGEIYLPQAKPGLVPENSISDKVTFYIEEYSNECLLRCLGNQLFNEFTEELDSSKENGLKDGSDEKWNWLLNGKELTDTKGVKHKWRGIRYKNTASSDFQSFLAYYVFHAFTMSTQTQSTSTGEKKVGAKNTQEADASPVIAKIWNKFVDYVQFIEPQPILIERKFGLGVDYFLNKSNKPLSLKEFIDLQNSLVPDTYLGYEPETFYKTNSLGI